MANADTWHVDQMSGSDGNAGDDWLVAFATLQKAISVASQNDLILVAEGEYHPSARLNQDDPLSATFTLIDGVEIYGGFPSGGASFEDRDPYQNPTILSGDLSDLAVASGCPNPNGGDCFTATVATGCTNGLCCDAVCAILPECCSVEWDRFCVEVAELTLACDGDTRAYHVVYAVDDVTDATVLDGVIIRDGNA